MPSDQNSPKLSRAAIMYIELDKATPKMIRFQYNPETLTRSLQGQIGGGGDGSILETFRIDGPPIETINIEVELDATDYLENPSQNIDAVSMGISPQLSALEILLYPKSSQVIESNILAEQGIMEIIPPQGPLIVFMWGTNRIVPVKLTKCDITEEAHDINLNPIRAKVSLGMQVLSYANFSPSHPGYDLFLTHHKSKEVMAAIGLK